MGTSGVPDQDAGTSVGSSGLQDHEEAGPGLKVTYRIPGYIRRTIESHQHEKVGTYSVTGLIQPVRKTLLELRHADEIKVPALDKVDAWLGHAVITDIERANVGNKDVSIERKLMVNIRYRKTQIPISGSWDVYFRPKKVLDDVKVTKVYKVIMGVKEGLGEWEKQLNLYRYMAYEMKLDDIPERLRNILILKDFSSLKCRYDKSGEYPKAKVARIEQPVWEFDKAKNFMVERVNMLQEAGGLSDDALPFCTQAEMWARPEILAVMKGKNKRASKLLRTPKEVKSYILKDGERLERRPAERPRCKEWCSAAPFCNQYQSWKRSEEEKAHVYKRIGT